MKGMLQRDWYGVRWWLVLILLLVLTHPIFYDTQGSQLIYGTLSQLLAMLPVRTLVQGDRASRWKATVDTLPNGRRRYAGEKLLLLVLLGLVTAIGYFCADAIYTAQTYHRYDVPDTWAASTALGDSPPYSPDYLGYLLGRWKNSWHYNPFTTYFPLIYFFTLSAVQMPMLLLSAGWFANLWEMFTWALSWVGILWLREGPFIRFLMTKESEAALPRLQWLSYPWPTILAVSAVLFVLSAGLTIYFSGRVREDGISLAQSTDVDNRPVRSAFQKAVAFLVTATVAVALGLCIRQALPMKTIYLYSTITVTSAPSFLITNREPSEIADEPQYKGYIPRLWYHADYADAEIIGAAGNECLVWDGGWFLIDLTSKEKTPVPIPGQPRLAYTQLLGEASPTAVALWDETAQAFAFYSFEAEGLITGYEYARFEDELVNGCIAAQRLDGEMVYIDPKDGRIAD